MPDLHEWITVQLSEDEFRYLSLKQSQPTSAATAFRFGRVEVLQQVQDILDGREPRDSAQVTEGVSG